MVENTDQQLLIAGGHPEFFTIAGDKILKQARQAEIDNYREIFDDSPEAQASKLYVQNKAFREFIPYLYSIEKAEKDLQGDNGSKNKFVLVLENLGYGMQNQSILDFKMGTCSYTRAKIDPVKEAYQLAKDKNTTTFELGIRVTAEMIRDLEGNVIKQQKKHYESIKKEDIPIILKQFLQGRLDVQEELSEQEKEALNFFIEKLQKMLKFFKGMNTRRIIGSSLLFLYDKKLDKKEVRLIDISDLEERGVVDEGMVKGFESMLKMLQTLT